MKNLAKIASVIVMLSGYGCGTALRNAEEDNTAEQAKKDPIGESPNKVNTSLPTASSSDVAVDEELAGAAVTDSVDDAISAIADEDSSQGGSLGLLPLSSNMSLERTCTETDGKVLVEASMTFSREWSAEGRIRKASHSVSDVGSIKRLWSNSNEALLCNAEKKSVAMTPEKLEGSQVQIDLSRNKSRASTFENKQSGVSLVRSQKLEMSGTRLVTWENVEIGAESYVASKSISSDVKRKLQIKNKKGEERIIETQVKVSAADPLKVEVTRDLDTHKASRKIIKSGSIEAVRTDKGKIVTHFENVVHTYANLCVAESGMIKGEIYEANSAEPALTFVIDFNVATKTIKFSNGKEFEYTPEGCDLETIDPMSVE